MRNAPKTTQAIFGGANSKPPELPYGHLSELLKDGGISVDDIIPPNDHRRDPAFTKFLRDPKNGAERRSSSEGDTFEVDSESVAEMLLATRPERYDRYFSEAFAFLSGIVGQTNTTDMDSVLWNFMSLQSDAPSSYPGQIRSMPDNIIAAAHIIAIKMLKHYESIVLTGQYRQW